MRSVLGAVIAGLLCGSAGPASAFDTGAIQGAVLFNGAPIPAQATAGLGAVTVQAGAGITATVDATGSFRFPNLEEGTYPLVVTSGTSPVGPGATTPVTAGSTTMAYLDLASVAGLATGVIHANGQPLPVDRIVVDGNGTSYVFGTDAGAAFDLLLPPGSYTATPHSPATGAALGTFPFTLTAGATTGLGTIAFDTGAIEGYVLFNGAPVPALAMAGAGALMVDAGAGITASVDATGRYRFPDLPAGPYHLVLVHGTVPVGAEATAAATIGGTATAYLDLTSTAGLASGVITANGQPLPVDRVAVTGTGVACAFSTNASAQLQMLLPSGGYTATAYSAATGAALGTFSFSVVAGATANLGAIALDTGAIEGDVIFNGAPLPALALTGAGALTVQAGAGIAASVAATGHFTFPNLPAGPYHLVLMHGANPVGAEATIPVTVGSTATASLDLSSTAGFASGVIRVNAQPFAVDRIVVDGNALSYDFSTDASGHFALLLPPGSYTATPRSPATGAILGTFAFTVAAGQSNAVLAVPAATALTTFALLPPAPNPATRQSLVAFAVPRRSHVRVTLVDVQGREVAVLADGTCEPGRYTAALPASRLRAGVYFVRLQAPGAQLTRRVAIVK